MDIKGNNDFYSFDILAVISSIASGCGSPINEITIEDDRPTTLKVNVKFPAI